MVSGRASSRPCPRLTARTYHRASRVTTPGCARTVPATRRYHWPSGHATPDYPCEPQHRLGRVRAGVAPPGGIGWASAGRRGAGRNWDLAPFGSRARCGLLDSTTSLDHQPATALHFEGNLVVNVRTHSMQRGRLLMSSTRAHDGRAWTLS